MDLVSCSGFCMASMTVYLACSLCAFCPSATYLLDQDAGLDGLLTQKGLGEKEISANSGL